MIPMLACTFSGKTDFPVYTQPKLNGIRCLASASGLWTRTGKQIVSAPHITTALAGLFQKRPDIVLDGELYHHSLRDDLATTLSHFQRKNGSSTLLQFHVFDLASEITMPFWSRYEKLANLLSCCKEPIFAVETELCLNRQALDDHYHQQLEIGFEGQMIRQPSFSYESKRSLSLVKRKPCYDEADLERVAA